jgi:glycosyltransferase involved in cell wall biosynthesis
VTAPRLLLSINAAWNIANFRGGLIRGLQAAGYEVVAAAPPDAHVARIEAMGCRFVPLPMENAGVSPIADVALLARYHALLRRERPSAFLGWTIKPNVYGSLAAQALSIPVVNNVSGLGTAFIRETWLTKVASTLYRTAFRRSHRVFFQNADDRRLFVERGLVAEARTGLLPGSGIDLEHFRPRDVERASEAGVYFLLVARLVFDKGVREFVEAARIVRAHRPEARFTLLGFLEVENRTAVSRADVEAWVAEGLVTYAGTTDDVRPHLAAADCVVLPSYREGAPRTLIEAAAMARPVIATDVPGCRHVVEDGATGLLCRVRDGADLAAKMLAMIEMGPAARAAMGRAGRAKMEREYDERLVLAAYLEALKECGVRPGG